jgi:hypothetical protein
MPEKGLRMFTTVKVHFDGRAFVPETPVDLPVGTVLEIAVPLLTNEVPSKSALAQLAEIADQFPDDPDSPPDLAEQHDHYLYGTSKHP